ncbi:hypothetical protein BJX61DRAFT_367277 [Aspergillus egyptiacus]|nr:hypothetical protein BJX61DRAFT_367277 [Aspergillus egyptiacus]
MADRDLEDFNEALYGGRYPVPWSARHQDRQHPETASYVSNSLSMEDYDYPHHNSLIPTFDPTADTSMAIGLGPERAFPYDLSAYPSISAIGHDLDAPMSRQPQSRLTQDSAYLTAQHAEPVPDFYWGQPPATGGVDPSPPNTLPRQSASTRLGEMSTVRSFDIEQPQNGRGLHKSSISGPSHRYIQPKSSSVRGSVSAPVKSEAGRSAPDGSLYSSSGIDMIGILARVVSRQDPKINMGPVDISCAFVLSDITADDHPIVYVSHAFEQLTGYNQNEIIGRNCRFLQSPDGIVQAGEPRRFTDSYTAFQLRIAVEQCSETQVSIINYKKGGQPFMNLVTMIPVRWESKDYFVGFQVDLVEKPDAVKKKNSDGTYMIDYNRSELPNYVAPSPDEYRGDQDPAVQFHPSEVAVILDGLSGGLPTARNYLHHILVENTRDVILVLSFEMEFLYLSPSCRTVLEYKSTDLLGKTLSAICHPSDIGPVTRELRACASREPLSVIYRIRRKYSGYAWFENHGGWHISERGRQFMVLVGRMVSVYSVNQLANIKHGRLAENDLCVKLSLSGIILYISSKCPAVLGRGPDELIGKCIYDIMVGDNSQQDPGIQKALELSRTGQQTSFSHKIRHRKGHIFPAQTTLYPGDSTNGGAPTFLLAHIRFPKSLPLQPTSSTDDQSKSATSSDTNPDSSTTLRASEPKLHPYYQQPYTTTSATITAIPSPPREPSDSPSHLFEELNPARGSSWHFELHELEKQNRILADEVQRLLARRKKRKRKQNAVVVEKACAKCQTKTTPEWRRGPSGNRDLCNSCGLRWAKQIKSTARSQGQEVRSDDQ